MSAAGVACRKSKMHGIEWGNALCNTLALVEKKWVPCKDRTDSAKMCSAAGAQEVRAASNLLTGSTTVRKRLTAYCCGCC